MSISTLRKLGKRIAHAANITPTAKLCEQFMNSALGRVHDEEYRTVATMLRGVSQVRTIADVGANIGQSLISFRALFPSARVLRWEPNPSCRAILTRVASRTRQPHSQFAEGLGAREGVAPFYVPLTCDGQLLLQEGSFDFNAFREPEAIRRIRLPFTLTEQQVNVRTLDSYGFGFDLIKLDVQGFELEVLHGAASTIERYSPAVLLERDRRAEGAIDDWFRARRYVVTELTTNRLFLPSGPGGR